MPVVHLILTRIFKNLRVFLVMTALIVAHGHPQFSKGGAEIAAYRISQALQKLDEWSDSVFLAACTDNNQLKPGCEIFGCQSQNFW